MSRGFIVSGDVKVEENFIQLTSGKAFQKGLLAGAIPLRNDNIAEIDFKLKFTGSQQQSSDAQKDPNCIVLQLSKSFEGTEDLEASGPESIRLNGAVLLLISKPDNSGWIATFRYFSRSVEVRRDYLNMLIEARSDLMRQGGDL